MAKSAVVKALESACRNLVFVSETEAKFEPFEWTTKGGELTPARILDLAGYEADNVVHEMTLESFFRAVPKTDRKKFDALTAVLNQHLSDIRVLKIGEVNCDVLIVGKTATGNVAGLKTEVVET